MSRFLSLSIAAVFVFAAVGMAQDAEISGLGGGIQFQLSMGGETSDGLSSVMTFMQVDPGLPSEPQALVRIPRVIDDLQLVDSQLAEIKDRTEKAAQKYQRRREDLASRFDAKAQQTPEFADSTNKINEAQKKELTEIVDSVLLPFQRTRLQQISTQAKLSSLGNAMDEFAKELDLTEKQKKELTESAEEFEQKLRAEIKQLRRTRQRERLESVLTDEQEKKLDELLGKDLGEEQPKSAGKSK